MNNQTVGQRSASWRVGGAVLMAGLLAAAQPAKAVITYTDLYTLGTPAGFSSVSVSLNGYQIAAGGQVVGFGFGSATGDNYHALLWNNSGTPIDLNPASGFTQSEAFGVGGGRQVGYGYGSATGNNRHALLWNGSNAAIDLNPASGFTQSFALGVGGGQQVGYGTGSATGDHVHALLWSGSAASYLDLGALLPTSFTQSYAYTISGTTVYGYAIDTNGNYHAMQWNNVPEPAGLALLALGGVAALRRRRSVGGGASRPAVAGRRAALLLPLLAAASTASAAVTYTDLYTLGKPAGFSTVILSGRQVATGGQVVGYGYGTATGDNSHALLWNNSGTPTDLNPVSGFTTSNASGVGGGQQVGFGFGSATGNQFHALLWNGTNAAVDLNPASGFTNSFAFGVGGGQQVGYGSATGNQYHALLWNGSNAAIDLNPASGFTNSFAYGVGGGQQVGYGIGSATGNQPHALLWNGTNAAVDLNPASGFTESYAYGVSGGQQVGIGRGSATGNQFHAMVWSGSAASYLDLGALLPASFTESRAFTISGTTVYGYAYDTSGNYHAIQWNNVPEPAGLALLALAGGGVLRRRR